MVYARRKLLTWTKSIYNSNFKFFRFTKKKGKKSVRCWKEAVWKLAVFWWGNHHLLRYFKIPKLFRIPKRLLERWILLTRTWNDGWRSLLLLLEEHYQWRQRKRSVGIRNSEKDEVGVEEQGFSFLYSSLRTGRKSFETEEKEKKRASTVIPGSSKKYPKFWRTFVEFKKVREFQEIWNDRNLI